MDHKHIWDDELLHGHKHHHHCECFDDCECNLPVDGITWDKVVTNRDEEVTFSLVNIPTTSVEWEIHDRWLGSKKDEYYVPELKSTGSFVRQPAELSDYIPRVITGKESTIKTNIFYPGPIEVICRYKSQDGSCGVINRIYEPRISKLNEVNPILLKLKKKNIRCAPIFTTQKFAAFYDGPNGDCILCSQLLLEEDGNKVAKIIFAKEDDPTICEHTWQTQGKKFLTYIVWYDNGFRAVSQATTDSYVIDEDEIVDKDDFIVSSPNAPRPPMPGTPQKVYVICTKRCWTDCENVNGTYEVSTSDTTGNGDYDT